MSNRISEIETMYRLLIDLDDAPVFERALVEVLRLLAYVTHCEIAYVELRARDGSRGFSLGHSSFATPPGTLRTRIPQDMIEQAYKEESTVERELATIGHRWHESSHAVCTPIGSPFPAGVVYVQGWEPFVPFERERVEAVAQWLSITTPLLTRTDALHDKVRALEERCIRVALARHRGNITEAARTLGVGRAFI